MDGLAFKRSSAEPSTLRYLRANGSTLELMAVTLRVGTLWTGRKPVENPPAALENKRSTGRKKNLPT